MPVKPIVVGISGGSGSGKSRFARLIQSAFDGQSTVIEQDWYYRDLTNVDPEQAKDTNFDHPSAIERSLLHRHLNTLILGKEVRAPDYSYRDYSRRDSTHLLAPSPVVIIEGLFILHWPEIRNLLQLKLYIDVRSETRFQRRLLRDTRDRGYTERQIRASWNQQTIPMHRKFIAPSAEFADFIWDSQKDTTFETRFLDDLRRRLAQDANTPK